MTDSTQSMIYRMLHPHCDNLSYTDGPTASGPCLEKFIMLLIVLNVLAFVLETVDEITEAWGTAVFAWFEAFSAIVFTIEYVLRFYSIGEEQEYAGFIGRTKFMFSFYALVDIAAIAPFYIDLVCLAIRCAPMMGPTITILKDKALPLATAGMCHRCDSRAGTMPVTRWSSTASATSSRCFPRALCAASCRWSAMAWCSIRMPS